MKAFCRRLCCAVFCCRCSKTSPLKLLDENTRLLPKNERTREILEKDELHCFGVTPDNLRGQVIDISTYTRSFVKKIVCGTNHCLIFFNDGQLAGFGSNTEGQLGFDFDKNENYINEIKMNKFSVTDPVTKTVISDYEIWDIGAGDNYSLIIIKYKMKSLLIRFGLNPEDRYKGELEEEINCVNVMELDYEKIGNITNVYVFGQRSILLNTNYDIFVGGVDFALNPLEKYKHVSRFGKQIRGIYLGLEHCLILDFEGGLFTLGDNTYGEMGLENNTTVEKPIPLNYNFGGPVRKVSVGARHSLVLLENGSLYSFGDNSEGQCAGLSTRYSTPMKIDLEMKEKIVDIYSGYNHNLIVFNNGEMFSWGDTSSGKLGYMESNLTQSTPRLIQVLKGKFPNYVALGFQMTVISTSSLENSLVNCFILN